jgi:hypothetical protein
MGNKKKEGDENSSGIKVDIFVTKHDNVVLKSDGKGIMYVFSSKG